MDQNLSQNEKIVVKILRESGCVSLETSMAPNTLLNKCSVEGVEDSKGIEQAVINLVDKDYIEYEMNENLETSDLWLINELKG